MLVHLLNWASRVSVISSSCLAAAKADMSLLLCAHSCLHNTRWEQRDQDCLDYFLRILLTATHKDPAALLADRCLNGVRRDEVRKEREESTNPATIIYCKH